MTESERVQEILTAHPHWTYIKTDRNKSLHFETWDCPYCEGTGRRPEYAYVDNGVCYHCNGSGRSEKAKKIIIRTPEYEAVLAKKREERRIAKLNDTFDERITHLGFGKEDETYVVYRVKGETYSKKEQLKELGCRFNQWLGWYSPRSLKDEGYQCQRFTAEDVLISENFPLIEWRPVAEVKNLYDDKKVESGVFVGEPGQKMVRKLFVSYTAPVETNFGTKTMNVMRDEQGNMFRWFTDKMLDRGVWYNFQFTVKDHNEYNGQKYTKIIRCKEV